MQRIRSKRQAHLERTNQKSLIKPNYQENVWSIAYSNADRRTTFASWEGKGLQEPMFTTKTLPVSRFTARLTLLALLFTNQSARAVPCGQITSAEIASLPKPHILVLAASPGLAPDLPKATRLVRSLTKQSSVTVGLQAISASQQQTLDKLDSNALPIDALEQALPWQSGFPFAPYRSLLTNGTKHVGLNVPWQAKPKETDILVPPGYAGLLQDGMGEHPSPGPLQTDTATFVAYKDHRMATAALDAWDKKGTLVLVVDPLHVDGGKGVAWQLSRQQQTPVTSVLLSDRTECYGTDKVLR